MELRDTKTFEEKATDHMQQELSEHITENETLKGKRETKTYISFRRSLMRVLNLCFSSFYFGYTIAYLGTFDFSSIATLYDVEREKDTVQGLLQGIVSIGAGFGALSASLVLKNFSRKNSILLVNIIAFISGLLVFIPNLYLFFVMRFVQGACIGLYSAIVPLLIKQYSPNEICATFGALNQTFIAFGVFFVFAFQLILLQINDQLQHWRIVYGFTLITILVQTLIFLFIYKEETPKYLLLHDRQEDCLEYLKQIYKPEFVKKVLKQKKVDLNLIQSKISNSDSQKQNATTLEVEPITELKFKHGRKLRIIVAIHLAVLQQFVGINSVVAYGVDIIAKILPTLSKVIPVILNLESVIASVVSSFLLAKVGRKIILQAGTFTAAISLIMVAIGFLVQSSSTSASNALIITGLVIFMANFGLSLGPVVWLYIAEIVEPQIIPFSTLSNWTAATIVIITFPILSGAFGTPVPLFFFFAVWSIGSLFVNKKILIETKGKTQKQIRQQYCLK